MSNEDPTHDPCCSRCKTPYGVCATKRSCEHHRKAKDMREANRTETIPLEELERARALRKRAQQ